MDLRMPPLPSFSIPRSMEINVTESEQHLEKELCTKYTKRCYMDSKFQTHEPRRKAETENFLLWLKILWYVKQKLTKKNPTHNTYKATCLSQMKSLSTVWRMSASVINTIIQIIYRAKQISQMKYLSTVWIGMLWQYKYNL